MSNYLVTVGGDPMSPYRVPAQDHPNAVALARDMFGDAVQSVTLAS